MTSGTSAKDQAAGPKPRPRQLRYLKDLAVSRGVSFQYPRTRAEASAAIDRLLAMDKVSVEDRSWEELVADGGSGTRMGDAAMEDWD